MLTHKPMDYFRQKLGIKTTRRTKKRELLAELGESGFRVVEKGRVSGRTPLVELKGDALLFGKVEVDGDWLGHWMVWDASVGAVRDPNGSRAPYRISWYAVVRKK